MFTFPGMGIQGAPVVDLHSFRCDGVNEAIYSSDSAAISGFTAAALEVWVRWHALPAFSFFDPFITKWDSATNRRGVICGLQQSASYRLYLSISDDGIAAPFIYWNLAGPPTLNVWYHYAFTWTAGGTLQAGSNAYIDSVDQGLATVGLAGSPTAIYDSDVSLNCGGYTGGYTNADFCEPRFWDVKRTGPQIAASYNKTIPGTTSGLQWYVHPTTVFADVSPNAAAILQLGTPVIGTDVPFTP